MNIETIPEDVYELLSDIYDHVPNEKFLNEFADRVKTQLRRALASSEQGAAIRFSSIGKPDRQLWYDAHPDGSKEKFDGPTLMKFLYGNIIEEVLLYLIKEAGHDVQHEQATIEVDGVYGHIDGVIDGVLVDVKSASPYAYLKFEQGRVHENDAFGYVKQLAGYANEVTPGEPAAWVVMDKVGGHVCVAKMSKKDVADNPPAPRIAHLKEVVKQAEPPSRCYSPEPDGKSGNLKLGIGCSYCPHKRRCYPGLRTFIYSNGPRFLTKVVRTPDVYEAR